MTLKHTFIAIMGIKRPLKKKCMGERSGQRVFNIVYRSSPGLALVRLKILMIFGIKMVKEWVGGDIDKSTQSFEQVNYKEAPRMGEPKTQRRVCDDTEN